MEATKSKRQIILLIVIFSSSLGQCRWGDDIQIKDEVHIGVIVDTTSREGKIVESCIAMAISDFYAIHHNYTTQGIPKDSIYRLYQLDGSSSALELLYKFKVEAIIGAQTKMEANFLAEIGNKAKLPILSVLEHSSLPPSTKLYPFLVHTTKDETSQFKGITALVESFKWRDVILIHGDLDFERDIISYMIDSLEESNIHITYKSVITTSYTDEKIINKELHKIMTFQTTSFIVHISQQLLAQLVKNAEELGMMSKGYAWVMSATAVNHLHFVDSSIFQSMKGVVGLKSYIPPPKDLHSFTSRLRRKIYIENPNMEVMESSAYGIWAYDSIWAVAEAVERTKVKFPTTTRNSTKSSKQGSTLLKEILQTKLRGLSGKFMFKNGRRMSSDTYEIVNVIGTTTTPKGRSMMGMNGIKLRIGVPMKRGFKQLVRVDYDHPQSNATYHVTGFCIDVFKAAVELLPYQIEYQFIPFVNACRLSAGTYNDLVHQVYLQRNYVGYQMGPATQGSVINLNFKGFKAFLTPEEYVEAFSRGSKHGGVSAIVAEIPYIKIFLAMYPREYSMIKSMSTTNEFGFNQSMEITKSSKNQTIHLLVICFSILGQYCWGDDIQIKEGVHVGVIVDMSSREGKIVESCIAMAISDFYGIHHNYTTRLLLHTRDSKGQHLHALSAALELLHRFKVEAIIGAETRIEANFLAEIGNKAKLPVVSVLLHSSLPPFENKLYPFQVHTTQDETSQFNGITALVESFKWRDVILIHGDSEFERDVMSYMIDSLQESNIHITYKSVITTSYTGDKMIKELQKIMTFQTTIFVVHISQHLLPQLVENAKELGMMSKGYAWVMSATTMNHLHFVDSSVFQSMQGVVGLKAYVPQSRDLHNLTSRLRRKFYIENPNMEVMESSAYGVWAYDSIWVLAEAVERTKVKLPAPTRSTTYKSSKQGQGSKLLKEILQTRLRGLSGEFLFKNGRRVSAETYEIVNVIGREERRVGFWSAKLESTKEGHRGRSLLSPNDLEAILWPGGTTTTPKGRSMIGMNGIKLRIGVPKKIGFKELVRVDYDHLQSNATYNVTGFCIDVFKAAVELLPYQVEYQFIPYTNASGMTAEIYDDLVYQVYLQKYDAVVGDTTIMSNRSLYVDFTIPYTDIGVGMVVPNSNKNMWIFLKPLSLDLWITTIALFIWTGCIVWLIERPNNHEFQGSLPHQIATALWFSFSTLVFAQKEKLLNSLSKFVMIIWVFVILILTSSYTATLTSMLTIQQIQLNTKGNYVGYGPAVKGVVVNLNFEGAKRFITPEEYVDALSKGSKHGGISAIIDEIPYIKIFLAKYPKDYSMIKSMSTTNGFGFVFRKGSPLVHDMSWAIEKLREEGELAKLETEWFHSKSTYTFEESTDGTPDALSVHDFGGLFMISGISSTLALLLFSTLLLKK
ncbi:hypothetical protein FNV43_RR21986 [Rhamnella rubrinervis]|uniref:Ionotropic glutamate receptor C-terminal domain-containing protein n=1 Tax=Rhamnella rubrinervis TaxID=2594499 RepID=A0A8K0DVN5_9ROSA|nr:hypothetical protein FNV43_RR21986 [Rhamnella rubrinervis]